MTSIWHKFARVRPYLLALAFKPCQITQKICRRLGIAITQTTPLTRFQGPYTGSLALAPHSPTTRDTAPPLSSISQSSLKKWTSIFKASHPKMATMQDNITLPFSKQTARERIARMDLASLRKTFVQHSGPLPSVGDGGRIRYPSRYTLGFPCANPHLGPLPSLRLPLISDPPQNPHLRPFVHESPLPIQISARSAT